MPKTLTASHQTQHMPVWGMGECMAQLGKRLTFADVIQLLVHERDEVKGKAPGRRRGHTEPSQ